MARKSKYKNSFRHKKNSGKFLGDKGLSEIVTTVIMVALAMGAIILVWVFVNNMIKKEIKSSESCFGNFDKIKLNGQYTCYQEAGPGDFNFRFSLITGDIQVDKIIVSVSSASAVKSFEITNTAKEIAGLTMYPSNITMVNLSGRNSGLTYRAAGFSDKIDSIQIAPVIGGSQCEVSDSISSVEPCIM